MGMASGDVPDPMASLDNHEPETLGRHIAGQNTAKPSLECTSNMAGTFNPSIEEQVEESTNHTGGAVTVMQESALASNLHFEPEAAQVNVSISHSYECQEDRLVGFQPILDRLQEPVPEGEGADGHSVHTSDDFSSGHTKINGNIVPFLENAEEDGNIVPFLESTKEDGHSKANGNVISFLESGKEDENVVPFLESTKEDGHVVPSKVHLDGDKTEEGRMEDEAGPKKEAGGPDEASAPLRMYPDISTETVSIKAVWDSDAYLSIRDVDEVEHSASVDKKQERTEGFTALVTMDIDGWQRFDAEEFKADVDTSDGIARQSTELWEQLLDDGPDGHDKDGQISPLQIASAPSPHGEDQYGLPSPGNPFVEGLERISSFSEVEGSIFQGGDLHSSHYLLQSVLQQPTLPEMQESYHDIEESSSGISGMQHTFEGPERISSFEGKDSIVNGESPISHGLQQSFEEQSTSPEMRHRIVGVIEEPSSSIPVSVGEDAKQPEVNNGRRQPSHTSFSQIRSSSFDTVEPFEAPSFMSLVDPKTSALFAAFMPTYQASTTVQEQENGGERWVANFELMAPPAQEISRSMSLPPAEAPPARPIERGEGHSFSFTTRTVQETKNEMVSPAESRPGASPKLSPLVQKVVDKVKTTHAVVANGIVNTVRQVMTPKSAGDDKATTSKETWLHRICC